MEEVGPGRWVGSVGKGWGQTKAGVAWAEGWGQW